MALVIEVGVGFPVEEVAGVVLFLAEEMIGSLTAVGGVAAKNGEGASKPFISLPVA